MNISNWPSWAQVVTNLVVSLVGLQVDNGIVCTPTATESMTDFMLGPLSVGPADDGLRLGKNFLREEGESVTKKVFKLFTPRNFRDNLATLTGKSGDEIAQLQAHHILPQKFSDQFSRLGLDINDPRFGTWVDGSHQSWSAEYNSRWAEFLETNPTLDDVLEFAEQLADEYGFETYFDEALDAQ